MTPRAWAIAVPISLLVWFLLFLAAAALVDALGRLA
jgi:hypothetical protein